MRRARSRPAEKRDPECLDEACRRQRRGECEQAADGRHQKLHHPLRQLGAQQNCLESKPFRDEAVEGRECGDRRRADKKGKGGERHAMDQPAQPLHVALARRR